MTLNPQTQASINSLRNDWLPTTPTYQTLIDALETALNTVQAALDAASPDIPPITIRIDANVALRLAPDPTTSYALTLRTPSDPNP